MILSVLPTLRRRTRPGGVSRLASRFAHASSSRGRKSPRTALLLGSGFFTHGARRLRASRSPHGGINVAAVWLGHLATVTTFVTHALRALASVF
jgi:hypothetical protein